MKKFFILVITFSLFLVVNLKSQNVGIGTTNPDTSAKLDVSAADKGFLPPRISLVATSNPSPVFNPATGLLVFNTAISGSTPTNVRPGYYYWDGSNWLAIINKANAYGDMQYWDGNHWVTIPLGLNGQVLTICNGVPFWGNGTCQSTLILQPASNAYEFNFNSYSPNQLAVGGAPQMAMQAWTAFGSPLNSRQILKFDLSAIPQATTIDSAKLFLYAADNPAGGNTVDAHSGTNNACYIQRITSSWSLPCPYSWNNPPSVTTTSQALIPQSTSSFQDNIIDVKDLVADMLTNGNNGFLIRLQNEVTYNIRQYKASYNTNTAEHPKLIIYYH